MCPNKIPDHRLTCYILIQILQCTLENSSLQKPHSPSGSLQKDLIVVLAEFDLFVYGL